MINLLDLSHAELKDFLGSLGEPPFRADQLWQWMHQKGERDFAAMTNLAKGLRAKLAESAVIRWPAVDRTLESSDGTIKFLLALEDGAQVETVLIPEATHYTQCLSTQVGCAMGCSFCATGTLGLTRNLSQAEIVGQILLARDHLGERNDARALRNLVFMGMGEPLANYDTVVKSIETIRSPLGLEISARRITVSTVGIRGKVERFGHDSPAQLAVSLHAPTQELRERIMPIAAQFPLDELMGELARFPLKKRERITIEYILLGGVNDSPEHARQLVRLLARVKAKVNLIRYNPCPELPYHAPTMEAVLAFEEVLRAKNVTVILRRSKGQDIAAACGQLAAGGRGACPTGDDGDSAS